MKPDILRICVLKQLPPERLLQASQIAATINPLNRPNDDARLDLIRSGNDLLDERRLAALTKKHWQSGGVTLTVGFLDISEVALRARILAHMNAWGKLANVGFAETRVDPQVRIARHSGASGGYWSYLGTDILSIAREEPTMNLEGFTMRTPESEFIRVVRHETGHTLGFPHEHMRRALIERIDPSKAKRYFKRTQGWSEEEVVSQVLTPIEESALLDPTKPNPNSIMCYHIPGEITKDGQAIIGGSDIDETDYEYAAKIYPIPGNSRV